MKVSLAVLIVSLGIFAVLASPVEKERKRLIKTSEVDPGSWMTEDEVVALRLSGAGFVDITNNPDFTLENVQKRHVATIPTSPRHQELVRNLTSLANQTRVENFLRSFTSYHNRHYQSEFGLESEKWLLTEVISSLREYRGDYAVREVEHSFLQHSIVARIEGSDPAREVVILGGHLDSIAGGVNDSAPGADDNASGSAVVLEVLRILAEASQSGFRPNRSIEFHWYGGEEAGLLGSADIARQYANENVRVVAMLNLDVVGYQAPNITDIGIFSDNGNADLVEFNKRLVDEYLTFGRGDRACTYACSDHASWNSNGYAASFVAEIAPNPNGHTPNDTFETVSMTQIMEFVKLAVGFAVEIAGPM